MQRGKGRGGGRCSGRELSGSILPTLQDCSQFPTSLQFPSLPPPITLCSFTVVSSLPGDDERGPVAVAVAVAVVRVEGTSGRISK